MLMHQCINLCSPQACRDFMGCYKNDIQPSGSVLVLYVVTALCIAVCYLGDRYTYNNLLKYTCSCGLFTQTSYVHTIMLYYSRPLQKLMLIGGMCFHYRISLNLEKQ